MQSSSRSCFTYDHHSFKIHERAAKVTWDVRACAGGIWVTSEKLVCGSNVKIMRNGNSNSGLRSLVCEGSSMTLSYVVRVMEQSCTCVQGLTSSSCQSEAHAGDSTPGADDVGRDDGRQQDSRAHAQSVPGNLSSASQTHLGKSLLHGLGIVLLDRKRMLARVW
jgi:hypothetical protein